MVIDREYIQELREHAFLEISKETEEELLQRFGTEPQPYVWSEQDLWEQVRKVLNRQKGDPSCGEK